MDIYRLKQKNQRRRKHGTIKGEHGMEKSAIGNQWNILRNKNGANVLTDAPIDANVRKHWIGWRALTD
jgi:hypothetical protein